MNVSTKILAIAVTTLPFAACSRDKAVDQKADTNETAHKEAAKPEVADAQSKKKSKEAPKKSPQSEGFNKSVASGGISFRVTCPNDSSLNKVTITPKGLEVSNDPIIIDADGTVTDVKIDDLDSNGFPEIFISVTSAGSGSYGTLIAYACNNGRSMTPIYMPDLTKDQSVGYMGHDEFAPVEGTLVRRFPLYKDADTNAQPSGKTRQVQYHLKAGEAGWVFDVQKTSDY